MEMKSVFIPVPVEERKPDNADRYGVILKDSDCIDSCYFGGDKFEPAFFGRMEFWLEKREDVFVMTKEELEKVFEAAREFKDKTPLIPQEDFEMFSKYDDFNDWLNQQSTLISSPISK